VRLIVLFLFSYVVGYSQCSDFITITVNGDSCVIPTSSIQSIKPGPDGKAKLYACLKPEDLNCITDQLFSDLAMQLTDCFPEPDPIICPDCTVAPNFNLMAKAGETINIDAGLVGCSSWAIENSSTVNGLSTSISSNGMIVVQVPEDYDGTVTFNYTATCLSSNSECEDCSYGGNVIINVTCDPCPIAQDFVVDAEQGETLTFDIGNAACETYEIQDVSAVGGFTQSVSQSGIVTVVIGDDFEGQIDFDYQADCSNCDCRYIGGIRIEVEKICDPCPSAESFDIAAESGETLTFDVSNSFCSEYEIQDVSAVGGFTQSVSQSGIVTIVLDDDFEGVIDFDYQANCTDCECSYIGGIRAEVTKECDPCPEAQDFDLTGTPGEDLIINISNGLCSEYEIQDVSAVGGFTQSVSQSGIVTIVLDDDFEGVIDFDYQANCTDCDCDYIGRILISVDPCFTTEIYFNNDLGEIKVFDVMTGQFTTICTVGIFGDIGIDNNGVMYAVELNTMGELVILDIDNGCSSTSLGTTGIINPNSLSFLPDNTALVGNGSSGQIVRITTSPFSSSPWADISPLISGGDFIYIGGKIYMTSLSGELIEFTVDANMNYVSHVSLGSLPQGNDASWFGLSYIDGNLYYPSGNEIFEITSLSPLTAVSVGTGGDEIFYGATSLSESLACE